MSTNPDNNPIKYPIDPTKHCYVCGSNITFKINIDGKPGHTTSEGYLKNGGRCNGRKHSIEDYKKLEIFDPGEHDISRYKIGEILSDFSFRSILLCCTLRQNKEGDLYRLAVKVQDGFINTGFIAGHSYVFKIENDTQGVKILIPNLKQSREEIEAKVLVVIKNCGFFKDNVEIHIDESKEYLDDDSAKTVMDAMFRKLKNKVITTSINGKTVSLSPDIAFSIEMIDARRILQCMIDFSTEGAEEDIRPDEQYEGKEYIAIRADGNRGKCIVQQILPETVAQHEFDIQGKRMSVFDYWKQLKNTELDKNDRVAIVLYAKDDQAYPFPVSRIKRIERMHLPHEARVHIIKHILHLLRDESRSISLQGLKFTDPVPDKTDIIDLLAQGTKEGKFLDLSFGKYNNGKRTSGHHVVRIQRKPDEPEQLTIVPTNLLGRSFASSGDQYVIGPIAGPQRFKLIVIAPTLNDPSCVEYPISDAVRSLKNAFKSKCFASGFEDDMIIAYNWPALKQKDTSAWSRQFRDEILPGLKSVIIGNAIPILLFITKKIGKLSMLFKDYIENEIYTSVSRNEINPKLRIIQGLDTIEKNLDVRLAKDAILLYYNALYNLQDIDDHIKNAIADGIVYRLSIPIGKGAADPKDDHDIFAGYDASGDRYHDTNEMATGAILVMMNEYGMKFTSHYFPYERSLAGGFEQSVIQEMLQQITTEIVFKQHKYTLYLVIDGRFQSKHRNNLKKAINAYLTSIDFSLDVIVMSCKKDVPLRCMRKKNFVFGTMGILKGRTFFLVNHQLFQKLTPSKKIDVYDIMEHFEVENGKLSKYSGYLKNDLIPIGLKLFYSSLLGVSFDGKPTKACRMLHGAHKLSKDYFTKPAMRSIIKEKL